MVQPTAGTTGAGHRRAGEHRGHRVGEVVGGGRRPIDAEVHVAVVDAAVVREAPGAVEHRGFGGHGCLGPVGELALRVERHR